MKKILILGSNSYKSLSVLRALKKYKFFVGVAGDRKGLAGKSRYCDDYHFLDIKNKIKSLKKILIDNHYDFLIPLGESDKLLLIKNRNFFDRYSVLPSEKSMKISSNKKEIMRVAKKIGINVPKTIEIKSLSSIKNLNLKFPILLKPSTLEESGPRPKYVFDKENFIEEYKKYHKKSKFPIIQEVIVGPGVGTFLLCKGGKVLQYFAHERTLEQDPCGSGSARCKSIKLTKELKYFSDKLAKELMWNGEIMLEFKRDKKTGKHYLIETNPRFWGSLPLAIYSGVNFPKMLIDLKKDGKINQVKDWNITESRYLLGELIFLARVFFVGKPKGWKLYYPAKWRALANVFFGAKWKNFFVFDIRDIKPFFTDLKRLFRR